MKNFSPEKVLKKTSINKYQIFALLLLFFTLGQTNHIHAIISDNSSPIQISNITDEHQLNSCVLCSVSSNQSFAIAEKKNENVLDDLKSLYLTSNLEVLSYFNLNNSKRAPPSFV